MSKLAKAEQVRLKLRPILPAWLKEEGRAPTFSEFVEETGWKTPISAGQYCYIRRKLVEEMQQKKPKSPPPISKDKALRKKLKTLLQVVEKIMEEGSLEEITISKYAEGPVRMEYQASPPPRKVLK